MRTLFLFFIIFTSSYLSAQEKQLDIEGGMKIGHIENDPADDTEAGSIRWNPDTEDFEGWDGSQWKSLTKNTKSSWFPPASEHCNLVASDGEIFDFFGNSVDVFGNIAIIGASKHNTNDMDDQGKAYIFERQGECWVQISTLSSLDGNAGDEFGYDVAISNEYAIVGAPKHDTNGVLNQGKAYIFEKPVGGWPAIMTQTTVLLSSDGAQSDNFGNAVSISGDVVIVGADKANYQGNLNQGSVYLFEKPISGWSSLMTQTSKLLASDGSGEHFFGYSVSITDNILVVGAYGFENFSGKAYVFEKPVSGWPPDLMESASLIASDGLENDYFGFDVDIDEDVIVVGAYRKEVGNTIDQGKAYVFVKPTSGWTMNQIQNADLIGDDNTTQDIFGFSVAISQNQVVVGAAYHDSVGNNNQGKAYIFEEPAGGWSGLLTESVGLISSDGKSQDAFGNSIGIYNDLIIVAASHHDSNGISNQGKAYIFIKN